MADDQFTPPTNARPSLPSGMRYHGAGIQGHIMVKGKMVRRAFPAGTPIEDISRWRTLVKESIRKNKPADLLYEKTVTLSKLLPPPPNSTGFVYFIQADRFVKIGHAKDIANRISMLQTAHALELRLVGAIACARPKELEAEWHQRHRSLRMRGEWFQLSGALLEEIRALLPPRAGCDAQPEAAAESAEA